MAEWPGYHLNALKYVRPGAKYVDRHRREYTIKRTDNGMWKIDKYRGGPKDGPLNSIFTSERQAEQVLINWLRQTDKFNKARYPGGPSSS